MKISGAGNTSRFSELISGESVDKCVRPSAWTRIRTASDPSKKIRMRPKPTLTNGTINPTRKNTVVTLPPNLGNSC